MKSPLTTAAVEQVAIDKIELGTRRRKTLGNLRSLEHSIDLHGLIHPLVVRNGNQLVSGARRLEACKRLGWKTVPVRRVESMTNEELRLVEFDENAHRSDLNDFDASKARLAEIRQAEADLKTKAISGNSIAKKSGRGRPKGRKPGSRRDIAAVTGIDRQSQANVERHVELAEAYPFLKRDGWTQAKVLTAGDALEKLPTPERGKVGALLDQDMIPPKKTIAILENLADQPVEVRREVYRLAQSDDNYDRTQAIVLAAGLPREPDPATLSLAAAERELKHANKVCRVEGVKPRIAELVAAVVGINADLSAHHKQEQLNGAAGTHSN